MSFPFSPESARPHGRSYANIVARFDEIITDLRAELARPRRRRGFGEQVALNQVLAVVESVSVKE